MWTRSSTPSSIAETHKAITAALDFSLGVFRDYAVDLEKITVLSPNEVVKVSLPEERSAPPDSRKKPTHGMHALNTTRSPCSLITAMSWAVPRGAQQAQGQGHHGCRRRRPK